LVDFEYELIEVVLEIIIVKTGEIQGFGYLIKTKIFPPK